MCQLVENLTITKYAMLSNYLKLQFDIEGKPIQGFCMQIQDDFHETYAVVLDGYHSFCIWMDGTSSWKSSKHTSVAPGILERIISQVSAYKLA
jgi:hypothetical protein